MSYEPETHTYDLIALEARARQLRAEAAAQMFRAAFAWLKGVLAPRRNLRFRNV